jgi:hypothetical protein
MNSQGTAMRRTADEGIGRQRKELLAKSVERWRYSFERMLAHEGGDEQQHSVHGGYV